MASNCRENRSFFLIFLTAVLFVSNTAAHWWSLANSPLLDTLILGTKPLCAELDTLSRNQRALCQKYNNHMQYVSEGATEGINECKFQFRNRRWNCSTVDDNSVFGKVLRTGSKEIAFTYAVSAAGVLVAVARACKNEQLQEHCGCSTAIRPEGLDSDWRWGGCGDNTEYAYGFAKEFVDARERDSASPRKSRERTRKAMNMHNNEAGRMVALRSSRPSCKCHGVSGSCSLKTCWMQIPGFREIGNELMNQYTNAIEVRGNSRGELRARRTEKASQLKRNSLVYLDSSPDYCFRNKRTGVLGTKGRECKKGASGPEGCGMMCCGRGFKTYRVRVTQKCRCKFQWCCSVKCEVCHHTERRHVCK